MATPSKSSPNLDIFSTDGIHTRLKFKVAIVIDFEIFNREGENLHNWTGWEGVGNWELGIRNWEVGIGRWEFDSNMNLI